MPYSSLRDFIKQLESSGQLVRVTEPVDTHLEMTEIQTRLLAEEGPAVLFENVTHQGQPCKTPVLVNLFGTVERVAQGMGRTPNELRGVGETLAFLRQPEPPASLREALAMLPLLKTAMRMKPKTLSPRAKAPCQEVVLTGEEIDLSKLPIQGCWPSEPAPLITWPLVVTQGPNPKGNRSDAFNLGIYRMQVTGKNTTLMRWLKHRGGAQHHARWKDQQGAQPAPLPVAVVIGADPATILAAVTPVPDTLSEYQFAGLLGGQKVTLVDCKTVPLKVPATAEIVLEGHVSLSEYGEEGPYGDHTGYYNSVERFPTFTVSAITMRKDPIYLSTFTGRPPDEPSVLGEALGEVFIPLIQQQFPEIVDFWLPPEGCSYRVAVVSMKKAYAGHAKRVMMGVWSFLRQFVYTKWVIVVDEGVDCRNWQAVMQQVAATPLLPEDTMRTEHTPIDYLDFASPISGLGGKLGLDATTKRDGERVGREASSMPEMLSSSTLETLQKAHRSILRATMPAAGCLVVQLTETAAKDRQKIAEKCAKKAPDVRLLVLVDADIDPTDWKDIIWALSTRADPVRDSVWRGQTLCLDAANKGTDVTPREWGQQIRMDEEIIQKVTQNWEGYGLPASGKSIWE